MSGVLLLSPQDLWAQRCAELDEESAVALGDGVLRVLENDLDAMHAALERLPVEARAWGRRALDQVRYEVCSPVETRLRLLLARAGAPEVSRTEHQGWTQVVVSSREVMRQPGDVVRWISDDLRRAGLRW